MRISIIISARSRDESLKRCLASLKRFTKDYEVIIIEGVNGYNRSLNKGIKKAKGEYIIFLHNDHEVTKGWADELSEVGSFQYGETKDTFTHWGGFYRPTEGYLTHVFDHPQYPSVSCLSREVLKKIGKLDEFYENPGYQDVDLGYQLAKAGYEIECLPGKIIHWAERTKPLSEKNRLYLHKKWGLE